MGARTTILLSAVAAGAAAAAATGPNIRLVRGPGHPVSGRAVAIVVRAPAKVRVWVAKGNVSRTFAAKAQARGLYRARIVFPTAGRWMFGARSGGTRVRLGSVRVRARLVPLSFVWPTSVDVAHDGSLLVVENGRDGVGARVLRLAPRTRKTTVLTKAGHAYSVAVAPSGVAYLSAGHALLRLDGKGGTTRVAQAGEDIGPVAVAANGDVYYETSAQVLELAGGTGTPTEVTGGLAGPHGLAVTGDGGLLVSDTGHGKIERVDLKTGQAETWGDVANPRGIDIARDGTVYVADGSTHRVVHLMADGRKIGSTKHVFGDPYDVATATDGSVYVVDTNLSGRLYRVAPNGSTTVVSRSSR